MSNEIPYVSIGLPVYNGEKFLEETISSILNQTFTNFELIISDNASTDRTRDICRSFSEQDRRIRYYRNSGNIGAARNFNKVFKMSSGKYFKWAAHDDLLHKDFLRKCLEILDNDNEVVVCFSKNIIIDERGNIKKYFHNKLKNVNDVRAYKRFGSLVLLDHWCFDVFGLIRSDSLKKTRLIDSFVASDRVLRVELGLLGRFHEVGQYLFLLRDHSERSVRAMPAHHLRQAWFDPSIKNKRVYPHWRVLYEYVKTPFKFLIKNTERARCLFYLMVWIGKDLNWAKMLSDLMIAVRPQIWKVFYERITRDKIKDWGD